METHRFRLRPFWVTIFLLLLVGACTQRERRYVVGISQCSDDAWRDKLNTELRVGARYYGDIDLHVASASDDDETQIRQINHFIDEGVDLLIISPNQVSTICSVIDKARKKGIPVVLFDRKTDTDNYTAYMGADNYGIGRMMGNYVASRLKGKGRIVEIKGLRGSSPAIERHRGFLDAIARYPGLHIVAGRYAGWGRPKAKAEMDSILRDVEQIDCVFAHNDEMAQGAREAMVRAGRDSSVLFVGIDGLPSRGGGLEAVHAKRLTASCIYPTRGDLLLELARDILEKKPFKKENQLPAALVTSENATLFYMQGIELKRQYQRLESLSKNVEEKVTQYNNQKTLLVLLFVIFLLVVGGGFLMLRYYRLKHRLAEEAANAKLRFFTNVSHEFRTPLTLIADPIDRLRESDHLEGRDRELMDVAHRNVKILLHLINEILDLRKVQSGGMKLQWARFDCVAYLRLWMSGFRSWAERINVELILEAPETYETTADLTKVEHIFYNLLSNALKFTPEGGRVTISLRTFPAGMELAVTDTGEGIDERKLPHIFDRFFQASDNTSGGTGVGLAIVKAYAEVQGGTVHASSRNGEGSTFTVFLPRRDEDAPAVPAAAFPLEAEASDKAEVYRVGESGGMEDKLLVERLITPDNGGTKPQILVVDDNQEVREYVAQLLLPYYDVWLAADGEAAWHETLKRMPDLVVSDVAMPKLDGLELCKRIKTSEITGHIPVLLLTANALDDAQRIEGYEYGAEAYVTKPFNGKVLLSRIENLLTTRRLLKGHFAGTEADEEIPSDVDAQFVEKFKAAVRAKLGKTELNVEELGADLGMSRVQLYRKVKALTGLSPVELIRMTRLKRAELLLRQGGKTVSEVAYEVGFSSPSYFSKCFRDYFGCSPGSKMRPN